jgi:dynein intermediate chain 1
VATNLVIYNFVEREYKGVPGGADEHVAVHFAQAANVLHVDSDDAAEQRAWEKGFRTMVDERRRDKLRAAQEEGKDISETDLDDDLQRNQFNFTERAAQTYCPPSKSRVVSTIPPETNESGGLMTQWMLYDAYMIEFDRLTVIANLERLGSKVRTLHAR